MVVGVIWFITTPSHTDVKVFLGLWKRACCKLFSLHNGPEFFLCIFYKALRKYFLGEKYKSWTSLDSAIYQCILLMLKKYYLVTFHELITGAGSEEDTSVQSNPSHFHWEIQVHLINLGYRSYPKHSHLFLFTCHFLSTSHLLPVNGCWIAGWVAVNTWSDAVFWELIHLQRKIVCRFFFFFFLFVFVQKEIGAWKSKEEITKVVSFIKCIEYTSCIRFPYYRQSSLYRHSIQRQN